tara:strand:- start:574 stop:1041 length:468 start_codon:yes stop_codon:yes gene_type:complete
MSEEYPFKPLKVINGHTLQGIIDIGMSRPYKFETTLELEAIRAPLPRLDSSIKPKKKREEAKKRGLLAKKRLQALIKEGKLHKEGFLVKTSLEKRKKCTKILGDLKYVYGRDLYNFKDGQKPWVGWRSVSHQLLLDKLVEVNEKIFSPNEIQDCL